MGTLLIISILLISALMVFALPQFRISSVEMTGLRVIKEKQVSDMLEITAGDHIFLDVNGSLKDLFQMRHTKSEQMLLKNLPYIKKVEIRSVFPSKLSIAVTERIEVAYIAISDGCVIIDAEGVVLEVLRESGPPGIPVIEGVSVSSVQSGQKAAVDVPDSLTNAIVLLNDIINADKDTSAKVKLLPRIKTIRPIQDDILFVTILLPVTDEEFIVKVRNSKENAEKMKWLRFAMEQRKLEGKGKGILDLTMTQKIFIPEK
ncbi:MAG: cell division protein FtsQ/DivIB [Saccharofermentanales bacterium]